MGIAYVFMSLQTHLAQLPKFRRQPKNFRHALNCQPAIAPQTGEQGGDYLLRLKANQSALLAEAERHTARLPASPAFIRWIYAANGAPVPTTSGRRLTCAEWTRTAAGPGWRP